MELHIMIIVGRLASGFTVSLTIDSTDWIIIIILATPGVWYNGINKSTF